MTDTMLADLLKLWSTASSEWKFLFLRRLSEADARQVVKALHLNSAMDVIEALRG